VNAEAQAKAAQFRSWLLGAWKRGDAGPDLDAVLRIVASMQVVLARQRRTLPRLRSAADCPPAQLPALGALVGVDRSTRMSRHMSTRRWRRFIAHARRIWRALGIPEGEEALAVAVTSRPAQVGGWHSWKSVADVSPPVYRGLDAPPAFDALGVVHVRAAAALDDADTRAFLSAALADTRPPKRAYRVSWHQLVETWAQGPWQWERTGAAAATVDRAERRATLAPGAALVHRGSIASPVVRARVQVPVGSRLRLTWCHQANDTDYGTLELFPVAGGNVTVRVLDGASSVLASTSCPWGPEVEHHLEVQVEHLGGDQHVVRGFRDGDPILAAVVEATWSTGGIGLQTPAAATQAAVCSYIEASEGAPLVEHIGPTAH